MSQDNEVYEASLPRLQHTEDSAYKREKTENEVGGFKGEIQFSFVDWGIVMLKQEMFLFMKLNKFKYYESLTTSLQGSDSFLDLRDALR